MAVVRDFLTPPHAAKGWVVAAFASYVAVFAAFGFAWLRQIGEVIPAYPTHFDTKLITWILAWVSHALIDPQARVFDANIYHPAPAQLTGSEHLFLLQPLFAPLYYLTGQAVVATGVVAFLTYPLGALAMAVLLVELGCLRLVAWLCGLAYAVGILRVPFNFHILQYPNLFLPLVALVALRGRRAGPLKGGWWIFLVLLAALLTSYYIAAIACVTLLFWLLAELVVDRRRMLRFIAAIGLALAFATAIAGLLLHPYVARGAGMVPRTMPWDHGDNLWVHTIVAAGYWQTQAEPWRIPFAFLALLCLWGGTDPARRRLVVAGAMLCLLGTALVIVGLPDGLGWLAAQTPLRNFRGWVRLLLITDFGLCLLAAAGLDRCGRRFGMRAAIVPIVAFALLTTLPRLMNFAGALAPLPSALREHSEAYRSVKRYADELGHGALLELPAGIFIDCEAMLGSTFHWLPLLNGFTGYAPPHARAIRAASSALPDPSALQDLIDLTHLRWILVRPNDSWTRLRVVERLRQGLRDSNLVGRSFSFDGFTLFEVTAPPLRAGWYPAIASGPRPGATALGTPIRRLEPAEAVATIEAVGGIGVVSKVGTIDLRVHNAGSADWPVLLEKVGPQLGSIGMNLADASVLVPLTVYLEAQWTPLAQETVARGKGEVVQNVLLDRDVLAGDTLVQLLTVPALLGTGLYRLDVRVIQRDGPAFSEPPSRMLHETVDLRIEPKRDAAPGTAVEPNGML